MLKKELLEYYNEEDDEYNYIDIDHVRRPRITLKHLNKLNQVRSIQRLEQQVQLKRASRMYKNPVEEGPSLP